MYSILLCNHSHPQRKHNVEVAPQWQLECGWIIDVNGWWSVFKVNECPNKYTWNFLTPRLLIRYLCQSAHTFAQFFWVSLKQKLWVARYQRLSHGTTLSQYPLGMNNKQTIGVGLDHGGLELVLKSHFFHFVECFIALFSLFPLVSLNCQCTTLWNLLKMFHARRLG